MALRCSRKKSTFSLSFSKEANHQILITMVCHHPLLKLAALMCFWHTLPSLQAQTAEANIPQVPADQVVAKRHDTKSFTGAEALESQENIANSPLVLPQPLPIESDIGAQYILGYTQYDLQSNAAIDNRVTGTGDAVSAVFTMSLDASPFEDRGTGYQFFDGESWADDVPYERLEDARVGWPSVLHLGNGTEVVITHEASGDFSAPLVMMQSDVGAEDWTQSVIPSGSVNEIGETLGNLWPRAAVGGIEDEIIHLICLTTPTANVDEDPNATYQGQDGALLYYRSMDYGATWEMNTFPELDSSHFTGFSGDSYAIHARGSVVAFAVFNNLADSFVMISQDAGDSWTYENLVDFPVDLYEIDSGLLPDSLGADYNEDGLNEEFPTTDGAGAVHVDATGQVHCVFGGMWVADSDTTDESYQYYPGTNDLRYWRQGVDSTTTIGYAQDLNGNGQLDILEDIADYGVGLASMPSMASDEDGRLFVIYSSLAEDRDQGVQTYRHVYLVNSDDWGETWNSGTPCDLTPDLDYDGYECVFASMSPDVDGRLDILYQRDFEPGLHVRGDEDFVSLNDMVHLQIPLDQLSGCVLIAGCTDPEACNYDSGSTLDDGSCNYLCIGCTDPSACNYDFLATTDDDSCLFNDDCGVCGGDNSSCVGCTNPDACNYDATAIVEDGSCDYSCIGCIDPEACNYDPEASISLEDSCVYPDIVDCDGNCLVDTDGDGVCDELEIVGCGISTACNFDSSATDEDITLCVYPGDACDDQDANTTGDTYDSNCTCIGQGPQPGCMNPVACNFDMNADYSDGSCLFPGDPCDDADDTTTGDTYTVGCECEGTPNAVVEAKETLRVYPNPAYGHVVIEVESIEVSTVVVFDQWGRQVKSSKVVGTERLDLGSLAAGTYQVVAQQGDAVIMRQSLVVLEGR